MPAGARPAVLRSPAPMNRNVAPGQQHRGRDAPGGRPAGPGGTRAAGAPWPAPGRRPGRPERAARSMATEMTPAAASGPRRPGRPAAPIRLPVDDQLGAGTAPATRKTASSRERAEAGWPRGRAPARSPRAPGGQRVRPAGPRRPAGPSRPPRATSRVRAGRPRALRDVADQQFGELLAVAGPPAGRVPAQQPARPGRRAVSRRVTRSPSSAPRRRSPASVTRRCASRCARSAVRACRRQLVGSPPVGRLKRLDHPLRLQPGERLVQGAGREPYPGELLDVLGQRVPVLGARRPGWTGSGWRARRSARTRPARPRQPAPRISFRHDATLYRNRYIGSR